MGPLNAALASHVGVRVRVRYLPYYDGTVEVFAAVGDGRHLGTACLAEAATPGQQRALAAVRTHKARALKADLKAADRLRRTSCSATTGPTTPGRRRTPTAEEVQAEIDRAHDDLRARALPDLIPPREPPSSCPPSQEPCARHRSAR
ncbi:MULTISPECIES: hypothetical protein [unclassified Streptomyces]|uniref:hypothetical protein n=1 Tax=unclassified Streptomyces TaxID=2593676 RepID=UPI002DD8D90C|nr:hypothetical protein [Streptomyces sp. NBC_01445]WSE02275.1 Mu transposase C-terminal domain-containing protein [Streptomyces sp. NBC_01445]